MHPTCPWRISSSAWRSESPVASREQSALAASGCRIESCVDVERWVLEHAGPVLDQLDAAVEGAVVDHLEGDVGVAVVDAFCAGGAGDHREHHDAEAIHESGSQERPAEADAADRADEA